MIFMKYLFFVYKNFILNNEIKYKIKYIKKSLQKYIYIFIYNNRWKKKYNINKKNKFINKLKKNFHLLSK